MFVLLLNEVLELVAAETSLGKKKVLDMNSGNVETKNQIIKIILLLPHLYEMNMFLNFLELLEIIEKFQTHLILLFSTKAELLGWHNGIVPFRHFLPLLNM